MAICIEAYFNYSHPFKIQANWQLSEVAWLEYFLFGPMEVRHDGGGVALGGYKQRAVLALLLLNVGTVVDFGRLVDGVWDDTPPPKPLTSLRAYVANLRRAIEPALHGETLRRLETRSYGYRLNLGADSYDIARFEALVGAGRGALADGAPAKAEAALTHALALWRGEPLAEFQDRPFADHAANRLVALRRGAVEARFEAALALGRAAELVPDIEAELQSTPLQERLWGQLMLALHRAGRRADALCAYERARAVLDEELGVAPSDELRSLLDGIRHADLALALPHRERPVRQRASANRLVGRSDERAWLAEMAEDAVAGRGQIVVLVGDSGMGKTSLAAALADEYAGDLATAWASHPDGVRKPLLWGWTQILRALGEQSGSAPAEMHAPASAGFEQIDAMCGAIREFATTRPLLIVLDDLHRADRPTHDVLALLSGRLHGLAVLIVVTWPDGGSGRPLRNKAFDRLLSRSDTTVVRLRGIDDDAVSDLIEQVSGVLPTPEFVAHVQRRTGGNPFYVRELVRLLRSRGRFDGGTRDIAPDDVPDAVAGVVRRRTSGLNRQTRGALSVAAIIGVEFDAASVAEVLRLPADVARARFEPAWKAGMIAELPGRPGWFGFSHGLVRDAVAAQLDSTERARTHADVALARLRDAAQVTYDVAFAAADHAWHAGTELDATMAIGIVEQAIAMAAERSAYADLSDLADRALQICRRLPPEPSRFEREATLHLQLASVWAVLKGQNAEEVQTAIRRAFELGERAGTGQFAGAVALRCIMICAEGRYREGAVIAEGLVRRHADTGDVLAGSAGYFLRSLLRFFDGDLDAALAAITAVDAIPLTGNEAAHLLMFDIRAQGVAVWIHGMRGDVNLAWQVAQSGIERGHARGDAFAIAVVRVALVQLNAMVGVVTGTAELADEVFAELAGMGMDQLAASVRLIGAWARALGPEHADSIAEARAAFEVHSAAGTRILAPLYLALLSDIECATGESDAARRTLQQAEALATATGERVWADQLSARRQRLRADFAGRSLRA